MNDGTRDTERTHDLKTHPRYWEHVKRGDKTFEVRKDDRGFKEGDVLVLHEWPRLLGGGAAWNAREACMCHRGDCPNPTRRIQRRVSYVLPGGQYGIQEGYVVLGLEEVIPVTGDSNG